MSAKWERSRAWGRRRLTGPLSPLRWALDALSSIPFAMIMLGVVALWGVLGTIPIGWTGLAGADLPEGALLRHHPAFDLTEGEWYRLWPFRAALALFVLNMIIATIRRIEFRWVNLGVLSVHAGIVLFAVGGWTYAALKREGVMLLPITDGGVYTQREVSWFSDMTEPAVLVRRDGEPDRVIPLEGLARYRRSDSGIDFLAANRSYRVRKYTPGELLEERWTLCKASDPGAVAYPSWELAIDFVASRPWTRESEVISSAPGDHLIIGSHAVVMMAADDSLLDSYLSRIITKPPAIVLAKSQALIRSQGAPLQRLMDIGPGGAIRVSDSLTIKLLQYSTHKRRALFPTLLWISNLPLLDSRHGGLDESAIQISYTDADGDPNAIWTPFSEFGDEVAAIDAETKLAFTLVRHGLKDASVRATDFTIIPRRKLSNEPADFIVRVAIADSRGESEQTIRLNQPAMLRASPESERIIDRCASWLGSTRYSLSVSGWDDAGWTQGQARYVVLTVGNTPGTDLVAVGAVLFALGTPWAFFVKPWVLRRRAAASGIIPTTESSGPTDA